MYKSIIIVSCATFLIVATYFFWPTDVQMPENLPKNEYRFVEIDCWFDIPSGKEIRCGELHTPADGGAFTLPVVRILDGSTERRADPVIYLQGGPGGSAQLHEEGINYWLNWLSYANPKRDFILMDPRGVGRSQPALTCAAYDQFSLNALRQNLTQQEELEQGFTVVEQCFDDLRALGFKPEYYGTEMAAQDLRALMRLLAEQNPDYRGWNLLGVSYGTRVAITAAQDSPAVRSLILDSVYPPGQGGLLNWPELFDRSLRDFLSWCVTNENCKPADESPMLDRLQLALHSLREHPVNMHIPRWNGEAPIDLVLNDHRFLSAMFSAIYSQHDWIHISGTIEAAINSERAGLQTLTESFINNAFSESFSGLVFMAVDCRDHPISSSADYDNKLKQNPLFANYMSDLWRYQPCHFLSVAENEGLRPAAPVQQPALLLAGALDPITPAAWARDLHQQWSASQIIILEDIGHAVINSDACIHENLYKFLDEPQQIFDSCRADF